MTFKNAVLNTTVEARTENGMKALVSTLNRNVDLFFKIGASRGKDITRDFELALQEDRDLALRIAQWTRDIREGAGERQLYRSILLFLEKNYRDILLETNILNRIPELGRWDDLLIFTDSDVKNKAFALIYEGLMSKNGLTAKWMPRKGTKAVELRTAFGWSPKRYRKTLVELTRVVETQMCAKQWSEINFSQVPSLAMSRYSKAFAKNTPETFTAYKEALKKVDPKNPDPEVKVNAGAVYPYDIVKNIHYGDSGLADEQWKALPNYVGSSKVLPVVDVSGSMSCPVGSNITAMDVAVSLGLYLSEKNTGDFKDLFLTFSESPEFVHVTGTISERIRQMKTSSWGFSTDLHAAMNQILKVAKKNSVPQEDMPDALLILSDMQFNTCVTFDDSAMEMIRRKYEEAGYRVPAVVFWNLNSRDNVPVKATEQGVALVSGFSPSIMKSVLASDFKEFTPEGIMKKTIMSERYSIVGV